MRATAQHNKTDLKGLTQLVDGKIVDRILQTESQETAQTLWVPSDQGGTWHPFCAQSQANPTITGLRIYPHNWCVATPYLKSALSEGTPGRPEITKPRLVTPKTIPNLTPIGGWCPNTASTGNMDKTASENQKNHTRGEKPPLWRTAYCIFPIICSVSHR